MKKKTIAVISDMFEKEALYLTRKVSYDDLALLTGEDVNELEKDFEKEFGYSLDEMVGIWRLSHARELLLKGVPYSLIWKFSGFRSLKEMERKWSELIY